MRLLLAEDDEKVASALCEGLQDEGFDVIVERTGDGAFFRATTEPFDLFLLDLAMPGRDGLEVIQVLRHQGNRTPVLIVSARDAVESRVAGLEIGADDYLVKPFAFAELVARVRALLRRAADHRERLQVADLTLDVVHRKAERDGRPIHLTVREYQVLEYLMRQERRVVSRESLAREVWGEPGRSTPLDNVIDVHIGRLRRKVDSNGGVVLIHTIRGVGFMLSAVGP